MFWKSKRFDIKLQLYVIKLQVAVVKLKIHNIVAFYCKMQFFFKKLYHVTILCNKTITVLQNYNFWT